MNAKMVEHVKQWKAGLMNIGTLMLLAFIEGFKITELKNGSFSILEANNVCITFLDETKKITVCSFVLK